jgi:hypothetical protein
LKNKRGYIEPLEASDFEIETDHEKEPSKTENVEAFLPQTRKSPTVN